MLLSVNPLGGEPPTGEPYAGELHVRFGGRGGRNQSAVPTPIFVPALPSVLLCHPQFPPKVHDETIIHSQTWILV